MPIPYTLDYVIRETLLEDVRAKQLRTLSALAGARVSDAEARVVWPRILEHKWFVSERLGRDVGLRVAALDYFENVHA